MENAVPGLFSCYDTTALVEVIKEARETCDVCGGLSALGRGVPGISGGEPDTDCEGVHRCRADVVVGSHTHCLQGVSYIDGKPVFYSLGNFYLRAEYRPVGDA